MSKKEKKTIVYELIEQLKALDAFGIDIYEATIQIKDNTLRIEDGKNSVNLFINNDMYGNSIHIYIRK